jgi:hypothetical protein
MSIGTYNVGTVTTSITANEHWDNSGLRARLDGQSNPGASFVGELQLAIAEREASTAETSRRHGRHAKRG